MSVSNPIHKILSVVAIAVALLSGLGVSRATAAPAEYRTEGIEAVLDEGALKDALAAYWSGVVNKMPPFKGDNAVTLSPEDFRILAKAPVQKGENIYFAVKVGFKNAKKYYLAPPFPMTMVVDPTGTLFFTKVIDIAASEEAILKRTPEVSRALLPEGVRVTTVKAGEGAASVTLVSDPFCAHCRHGYKFLSEHMEHVLVLKVIHNILFDNRGSAVAAWVMEYAVDQGMDPAAIFDFTYMKLKPVDPRRGAKGKGLTPLEVGLQILSQYQREFPALFDEVGGDLKAMYKYLSMKYAKAITADRDRLINARLRATPVFKVDEELIHGFDEHRLAELLSIPGDGKPAPATDADCGSKDNGLCSE